MPLIDVGALVTLHIHNFVSLDTVTCKDGERCGFNSRVLLSPGVENARAGDGTWKQMGDGDVHTHIKSRIVEAPF